MKRLFFNRGKPLDPIEQKRMYDQYFQTVFRTAFRYCTNRNDALEIVQETFVRAFKHRTTFQDKGNESLSRWLKTIARNESLRLIKKQAKYKEVLVDDIEVDFSSKKKAYEAEELLIKKEQMALLHQIIDRLPAEYQKILVFRIVHEMSYKEIGKIFEINESTARQGFHRAKNNVKSRFDKEWKECHDERA